MPKSDLLQKLEDTIKRKERGGVEAMNAKEFVESLKDFVDHKDSKSRFFSARFHRLGDDFDDGVVIIKFASAKKKDTHNDIMKGAKTKFIISIDGFDGIGRCKGNGKCRLNMFSRLNRNGERREWDEKKNVNIDGTHSEILRHLLSYFDKNLVKFTDSSIKYIKGEEVEKLKEDGGAVATGPVAGTTSSGGNVGTQGPPDGSTDTADKVIDQDKAQGISRFKRPLSTVVRRKKEEDERKKKKESKGESQD